MATTPITFTRLRSAIPATRVYPGTMVTSVAARLRPVLYRQAAPRSISLLTLSKEPEDARITGGTRSLDRRLLALNLKDMRLSA
jgi:hypothetical protein